MSPAPAATANRWAVVAWAESAVLCLAVGFGAGHYRPAPHPEPIPAPAPPPAPDPTPHPAPAPALYDGPVAVSLVLPARPTQDQAALRDAVVDWPWEAGDTVRSYLDGQAELAALKLAGRYGPGDLAKALKEIRGK